MCGSAVAFGYCAPKPRISDRWQRCRICGANRIDHLMQRPRIGFPIKIHERMPDLRNSIVGVESQHTGQRRFCFGIPPKKFVSYCCLLQRENIARIEFNRALKVSQRLVPAPLLPFDVTLQRGDPWIARYAAVGNLEFSQSTTIIEVSKVEIPRMRQMSFASIGSKANGSLDSRFGLGQARWSMVPAEKINREFSKGELAIRIEKRRITRNSLVQQIGCL